MHLLYNFGLISWNLLSWSVQLYPEAAPFFVVVPLFFPLFVPLKLQQKKYL